MRRPLQILKSLLLLLFLTFFLSRCEDNLNGVPPAHKADSVKEEWVTQLIQENFSLENFNDPYIKDNLIVYWDVFRTGTDSTEDKIIYEFETSVQGVIENKEHQMAYTYKVLASQRDTENWDFEVIKLLADIGTAVNGASYLFPDDFSGTSNHYNLEGENIRLTAFEDGDIVDEIDAKALAAMNKWTQEKGMDLQGTAPVEGGGNCFGCYDMIVVETYTDWYLDRGNGVYEYSHSTYQGSRTEWVRTGSDGDYSSVGGNTYHGHHGGGHAPPAVPSPHDDEVIYTEEEIEQFEWYEDDLSQKVTIKDLMDCFNNIQPSSQAKYSLTIYVEQPVPNTTKTYSGTNPGHTFISMSITDPVNPNNNITQVFGYYPATSVNPLLGRNTADGEFHDNSQHIYHVKASIDMDNSKFYNIVNYINSLGNSVPQYNLKTYNCTDFGISVANLAGMSLPDTYGTWPLGGGSNPGNLGQDIRNLNNSNVTVNTTAGSSALAGRGVCN